MKGTIKKTLHKFGLSEKESEVFIFLGKHGPLKRSQISKQLKMNKGQVYRILKGLQKKALVEVTLEHPSRFTAVPFEQVLDSFIKSKRQEVDLIEDSKNELLSDWKTISQTELKSSLERFSVIEGEKRIFKKISLMIKETKQEFVTIASVYGLLRSDHYGLFDDMANHPLKSKVRFRFLTQLTKNNFKMLETILKQIKSKTNVNGRDPSRGSSIFPKMAIKDDNEILLFISDESDPSTVNKINAVMCTNCQSIIDSFYNVFQELWKDSSNIYDRIAELESGKPPPIMELIKKPATVKERYYDALDEAKEEIFIVTSPKRLVQLSKNLESIKKWCKNGVSIKIMAPITTGNLKATQTLLTCSEVRHIPTGYMELTIIDDQKLFQFTTPCSSNVDDCDILNLDNVFFTTDSRYIGQTKKILFDVWEKTRAPSSIALRSRIYKPTNTPQDLSNLNKVTDRPLLKKLGTPKLNIKKILTEKWILDKYLYTQKIQPKKRPDDKTMPCHRYFGNEAFAIINPPETFNLPTFIIGVFHLNEKSSFGKEDFITIFLRSGTQIESKFIPKVVFQNNKKSFEFRKLVYEGTPAQNNFTLLHSDELHVTMQGNSLFVGWTKPIPLPEEFVLPPSCILFEGYGKEYPGTTNFVMPSGYWDEVTYNSMDAFVTFFHPSSEYVGSGSEGFISKNLVLTSFFKGKHQPS